MIEPGDFLAIVARAELRTASGDWAEAAALWAQVTAENPVNGDYWARLAEARFASQEYTAARQAYEKVRERDLRRRAHRIAPELHRRDHLLRASLQQGPGERRGPVLADLMAG